MSETGKSADIRSDPHRYDDMVELPHPASQHHPRMPMADRAAQFSPFAALTGHSAAIAETARLTDSHVELEEDEKARVDARLQILREHLDEQPEVSITYFQPDGKKAGGAYLTATGRVKKIDEYEHAVVMRDMMTIPIDEIIQIGGPLFESLELSESD